MAYEQILYEVKDRIATVTLNRPDKMNTWTDTMSTEVYDAMHAAAKDPAVRVIVFTGAGRAFCAGADVNVFEKNDPNWLPYKLPRTFDMNRRADFQGRHTWYPAIPKPIIGMINGAAAGLGLLQALCCDIRFCSQDATISTAFSRIGLSAEYGAAWILTNLVGRANALDLLISARRIKGPEAKEMGLVNKVFPADQLAEATYAYARDLAENCSPRSMRMMKKMVWEVPFQSLAEAVIMANDDMVISNAGPDFKEGTKAFMEKRKPVWQDE